MLGESADFLLRKQLRIVRHDEEFTAASAYQLSLDAKLILDRSSQTGRLGTVVSNDAIANRQAHFSSPGVLGRCRYGPPLHHDRGSYYKIERSAQLTVRCLFPAASRRPFADDPEHSS